MCLSDSNFSIVLLAAHLQNMYMKIISYTDISKYIFKYL